MKTATFPSKNLARSAICAGTVLAGASAMAFGCSSSTPPASPATDSGAATNPDAASDAGPTLYERLGMHDGIRKAVNAIVAAELQNQNIASYFFFQAHAPGNGHPTADQVEECFTDFVGVAVGGPEVYPTTVVTDAGSFTCRALTTIHAPLLISGGTFDTFVMIAGVTLATNNVSAADVTTLANALVSTKSSVITASLADAGLQPYPGDGGAAE
jgi:hypothetical protein